MKQAAAATTAGTRDRLIDATCAVVARDGLDGASVKTIAAEAAITPGLLHYHFPNKEALLEAALRRATLAYGERLQAIRDTVPPGKMIAAYLGSGRRAVDEVLVGQG